MSGFGRVPTKNSVRVEPVAFEPGERSLAYVMLAIIFSLASSIWQRVRRRALLQVEVLALRHQLLVLQGGNRSRRFRLTFADHLLWG